ncbi:MAG: DUF3341 domain-containing protein [Gemmatimonadota bacterium]|nr:DUF3341 domain-containing protein [Candidatus Palauibacterales bacterium]
MAAHAAVSARFDDVHTVLGAVRSLREQGHEDVTLYGPVMEPELEDALAKPRSPVRRYALIGGIMGGISGFALTIWSSYYYPLVVGGKPLSSIPAYVVIGFEMTILFAGISALIGMLIHNRMPTAKLDPHFDPSFTEDTFGLRVVCSSERSGSVELLLRSAGSREVNVER